MTDNVNNNKSATLNLPIGGGRGGALIHYCWFGRGKKPELAERCIASWRKYMPGYEIKEWNEDNFDIHCTPYVEEAYNARKYAFVSDYARFWILYKYGGVYFDTDVEVIRPMGEIIARGPFMGVEDNGLDHSQHKRKLSWGEYFVNPGVGMALEPGMEVCREMLDDYHQSHFILPDGSMNQDNVVSRMTRILQAHGLVITDKVQQVAGITIYPKDWLCPIRITDGKLNITQNTVSIHHYAASWTSPTHRFLRKVVLAIGGARLKNFLREVADKLK